MNIDFELYRIFNQVANSKNITVAANELHISQPAVSKAIKTLEDQLGGKLFVRTKKGVIKTTEGEELHKYIKSGIEFFRNGENQFTNMVNLEYGSIKIGISKTLVEYYLLPYLKKFHEKHPNIKIEINTNITSQAIIKLRDGLLDFIVTNLPIADHSDIESINLLQIQDVFVANPSFDVPDIIKLNDLNKYPLILQPKGNTTRDYLDSVLAKYNIFVEPEMTLASYGLVNSLTKVGYGIGYQVASFVEKDLKEKKLKIIKTEPAIPPRNIGLLTKKNTEPSFAAREFIKYLKTEN